jgi:hypothetical protein
MGVTKKKWLIILNLKFIKKNMTEVKASIDPSE